MKNIITLACLLMGQTVLADNFIWHHLTEISYDYAGSRLAENWNLLHRLDKHPFPTAESIKSRLDKHPALLRSIPTEYTTPELIAQQLQEAWRILHEGDWELSYRKALILGPVGYYIAGQALYHNGYYLSKDRQEKEKQLLAVADLMTKAIELEQDNQSNRVLFCYALGRYLEDQPFSLGEANNYRKLKKYAEMILEEDNRHLGANLLLASLHAKGVLKAPMLSRLYFGSTAEKSMAYYEKAFAIDSNIPLGLVAYADNILKLYPQAGTNKAISALQKSVTVKPWDASSYLTWRDARHKLDDVLAKLGYKTDYRYILLNLR